MGATSTITSKGQITLPVEVRERLGVGKGDKVEFAYEGGVTVVRPSRPAKGSLAKWVGIGKDAFKDEKELLDWERDMRGWDDWDKEHSK